MANRVVEGGDPILEVEQTLEKLETLEKEHKRVVYQFSELKEKESKLIREINLIGEKKSLAKVSQMESEQLAVNGRRSQRE